MCETSKRPAAVRTARCSSTMPLYWTGISQPAKGTRRPPSLLCSSYSDVRASGPLSVDMGGSYHRPRLPRKGAPGVWLKWRVFPPFIRGELQKTPPPKLAFGKLVLGNPDGAGEKLRPGAEPPKPGPVPPTPPDKGPKVAGPPAPPRSAAPQAAPPPLPGARPVPPPGPRPPLPGALPGQVPPAAAVPAARAPLPLPPLRP